MTSEKVRAALILNNGNVTHAAKTLGVSRVTLYKWMKRYGMYRDAFTPIKAA